MNHEQTNPLPEPRLVNVDAQTSPAPSKLPRLVFQLLLVAAAFALGFLAWKLGLFMNFIFVLLLLLVPINLIRFAWRAWRRQIHFGLLRRPFARDSRPYWWPSLARVAFYLCCGYLLSVAIVPFQFPEEPRHSLLILSWSLVALQVALAIVPAKRVSLPATGLFSFTTIFLVWQFARIANPPAGETVLLGSPLPGVTCVLQGGNSTLINHHFPLESQHYAVDLLKVAETADEVRQWKILEGDASFGQPVYAPCDGRVAYVENSHPDNPPGETDTRNPAGNYLTIEVAPNRYVLLAHLKAKSLLVKPGDELKRGQPVAQCGNSGNTSGPHLHLQVQTSPRFSYHGQTVPMTFRNVLRGDTQLQNVQVRRNDVLLFEE